MENYIKAAAAIMGGITGYMFGALDGMLLALISLMMVDYVTGIMIAIIEKTLSSQIGFRGICKKMIMLGVVAVAHIIDKSLLGDSAILRTAACAFYIANEGLSVLENAANLGIPLPKKLMDVLKQLKDKNDEDDEEESE